MLVAASASAEPNASLSLLQAVKQQETPALAPTSVLDMLGLLYYGADGRTKNQLGALFGGASQDEVAAAAAKAKRQLPGYQRIGSVWFSNRVAITPEFLRAVENNWHFYISAAPLRTDPAKAASDVNFWYDQKTNGYVKSVITPTELESKPDILAVIVTAFISPWKETFKTSKTKPMMFFRSAEEKFMVQMMTAKSKLSYYEDDAFQALKLSYQAKDFELLLFLPRNARESDAALGKLNAAYLETVLKGMKTYDVDLQLPRVEFTVSQDWREIFLKSKLAAPFTAGEANFKRINNNDPEPLYIAKLKEEVLIRWNEEGTEARSIITGPMEPFGSAPELPKDKPATFHANHPFAFLIYNKTEKDVAFAGIIQSPQQMQVAQ